VRAVAHFGAVPHRLAYDNLKAAVARHLVGSERELTARFLALSTQYLFEACFARPRTGHDKGGVEARGKGIRWQELVPIPSGPDLGAVSATGPAGGDVTLSCYCSHVQEEARCENAATNQRTRYDHASLETED
jgi:hypothetical protein